MALRYTNLYKYIQSIQKVYYYDVFLLHIHVLGLHDDTILFVQYSELRTGD